MPELRRVVVLIVYLAAIIVLGLPAPLPGNAVTGAGADAVAVPPDPPAETDPKVVRIQEIQQELARARAELVALEADD